MSDHTMLKELLSRCVDQLISVDAPDKPIKDVLITFEPTAANAMVRYADGSTIVAATMPLDEGDWE